MTTGKIEHLFDGQNHLKAVPVTKKSSGGTTRSGISPDPLSTKLDIVFQEIDNNSHINQRRCPF